MEFWSSFLVGRTCVGSWRPANLQTKLYDLQDCCSMLQRFPTILNTQKNTPFVLLSGGQSVAEQESFEDLAARPSANHVAELFVLLSKLANKFVLQARKITSRSEESKSTNQLLTLRSSSPQAINARILKRLKRYCKQELTSAFVESCCASKQTCVLDVQETS